MARPTAPLSITTTHAADGSCQVVLDNCIPQEPFCIVDMPTGERTHRQGIPCPSKRDAFLEFTQREILQGSGTVSARAAKAYAECESERYLIVQDRLFASDFDRAMKILADNRQEGRS
ncbi:hypothetical protein [uncultured Lamprocystis sp.]|jgi:hypothetical protein|uniref:hypothetical protein n=1 Tax=uncultured Lamprocystis sp. TaxID=543132 RepID=UPI0025EF39B6|nr:hypothetical protein [uncultured Lamprocystis sp.]